MMKFSVEFRLETILVCNKQKKNKKKLLNLFLKNIASMESKIFVLPKATKRPKLAWIMRGVPLVSKTDTSATDCQYIKIERFILHIDCFKLAQNRQNVYSRTLLEVEKVELAFFELIQASVNCLRSESPANLKKNGPSIIQLKLSDQRSQQTSSGSLGKSNF